jgi:hypothetical protein
MIQDLNLYLNLQGRALVSGPNDSTSPGLSFMQGDTYRLVLNGLLPVLDNSLTLYAPAHIQWSRLSAGITLIDAAPTGGTFKIKIGAGATTLTLSFNVGKGELQAALNAIAAVTAAGGIDVASVGAPNIYRLQWRSIPVWQPETLYNVGTLLRSGVHPDFLNVVAVTVAGISGDTEPFSSDTVGTIYAEASSSGHPHTAQYVVQAGGVPLLAVVENSLSPLTLSRVAVDPDVTGKVELKLYQAPVTLTDQFSLPSPPAITLVQVRAGSTLRNEVQRIIVPEAAIGSFALDWLSVAGTIIPVATVTGAAIEAALNDPFYAVNSTDQRFSVINPASGIFDVEFVGAYSQTAGLALIGIEMFDQVPIDTPIGIMSLDNQAIEDFLDGAASGRAIFEIRAYDSEGNKTMLAHLPATIVNDGIDDEVSSLIGTIATRVDTVYVYPVASDPAAIAKLGAVFTNPTLAHDFIFTHNFATMAVDVVVLVKTATGPDAWRIMPDDQYEADILNASQVRVLFGTDRPASPAVGSVQVWICTLAATPIVNNHRHTTDAIDGVAPDAGHTLTQIIAQLRAAMPTGWPNIPANMIVGTLSSSQIDVTGLATLQQTNAAFLSLFRLLVTDSSVVSNIANSLVTSSDFVTTLTTLFSNSDLLTALMGNLGTTADFISAVKLAVASMQIPGLMTIPIAPVSEILFTVETDPANLSARGAYLLPQVIAAAPTSLTTSVLPAPAANTVWQNNSGGPLLIPGGGGIRSGTVATLGFFASDGRILYPVAKRLTTNSYFPEAFKRELWRLWIDDKMLPVGKTLTVQFAVALAMINAGSNAQYALVIEKGTADAETSSNPSPENLQGITWDETNPLVKQRLILTQSQIIHSFGAIITNAVGDSRSGGGITAQGVYYSTAYAATAPLSTNFVLRARLIEFDTENSVANARGWVSYALIPNSYGELGGRIA